MKLSCTARQNTLNTVRNRVAPPYCAPPQRLVAAILLLLAAPVTAQPQRLEAVLVSAPAIRASSTLTSEDIAEALPGSTPLKLISALPGVNHTGSDSFGAYEWGNDLSLRGFSGGQTGTTLDAVPLGSNHFWYYSGIEAHRAIITENIAQLTVTPGSGALDTAAYNALGAAMQIASRAPAREFAVRAGQMFGENRAFRTHASLDSGVLDNGMTAYVSVASATSDKWKGVAAPGQRPLGFMSRDDGDAVTGAGARFGNYHDQVNVKALLPLGRHSLSLYYAWSDKRENDYADITLPVYRRLGRDFDNHTDWRAALQDVNEDAYYGSAMSWRADHLLSLTGAFELGRQAGDARLELTPYAHRDWGNGDWHLPYSDGTVMTDVKFRRSELALEREGVNGRFTLRHGAATWTAGLWLEESRFKRQRYAYDLFDWQNAPTVNFDGIAATLLDRRHDTRAVQGFVRFDAPLGEQVRLSLGAKAMRVRNDFTDLLGAYANRSLIAQDGFLPQAGIHWQPRRGQELFAYYAENTSALPITAFTTRTFNPDLRPENSHTLEAGWRGHGQGWEASASAYWIDYRNRILQISNCTLLGTCPSLLANVGSVRTRGAEASLLWQATDGISWRNALSINDSRYQDDYLSAGSVVRTAGKRVVNSPRLQFSSALHYAANGWFAQLAGKYTGERAASYSNDLMIASHTLWRLAAGYERAAFLGLKKFRVQLNVENLGNRDYLATLGAAGYNVSDPTGASTYFQVGAPRAAFVSVSGEM